MSDRSNLAVFFASAAILSGCGAFTQSYVTEFESTALNRAWYGAYDRPIADADAADRSEAAARAEERAQLAAARQAERDAEVAARRDARSSAAEIAAAEEAAAREALRAARAQLGGEAPEETPASEETPAPVPVAAPPTRQPPAPVAASTARPPLPETQSDASYNPMLAAGYLRAVYAANETPAGAEDGRVVDLYRYAQEEGTVYHSTPAVGDLVFFHNTFDADVNGRNNDWYTHAGLVEDVAADGTISVLSYVDGRVARTFMNLAHPQEETLNGRTVNSTMRRRTNSDPEYTVYLAGQLFAGFASLLGNREEVVVLDSWQPPASLVAAAR